MIKEITLDDFKNNHGLIDATEALQLHLRERAYDILATFAQNEREIFEFGTEFGSGTEILSRFSPPDTCIWTIDIVKPEKNYVTDESKIIRIIKDSRYFNAAAMPRMSMIFIDGDHERAGVLSDTIKALQMSRSGTMIVWHDWNLEQVRNVVSIFGEVMDVTVVTPHNIAYTVIK